MEDALTIEPPRVCRFCQIIRREIPSSIVFEDETSLAFLDTRPLFPGHCLLVPKAHYETLADLPAALVAPLFQSAQRIERAIENSLQAEGTFVAINNRVRKTRPAPAYSPGAAPSTRWAERLLLAAQTIQRSGNDAACSNASPFRSDACISEYRQCATYTVSVLERP